MAKGGKSPPPPNPAIVSSVAFDRYAAAEANAGPSPAWPGGGGGGIGRSERKLPAREWLRNFVDGLSIPAQPSPEEARAAIFTAGLQRQELAPDDERVTAILAPRVVLSVKGLMELTGLPAASVRRAAQVLRDEGRLVFEGPGRYLVVRPDEPVWWPETDRAAGWVITRGGGVYAF